MHRLVRINTITVLSLSLYLCFTLSFYLDSDSLNTEHINENQVAIKHENVRLHRRKKKENQNQRCRPCVVRIYVLG